jgi:hypothetical protein
MTIAIEVPMSPHAHRALPQRPAAGATARGSVLSRRAQSLNNRVIRLAPIMVRVVHHNVDKNR